MEMKERWKRLVKSVYKKEGWLNEFEWGYEKSTKQKILILNNFKAYWLEELLERSTQNAAQLVVFLLIRPEGQTSKQGVLADIETSYPWLKMTSASGKW